jgi:NADH-quinone oxidoreductase subunit N
MNSSDVIALLPMILPSCTAILILLLIAIKRNHTLAASCAVAGLAASLASLWAAVTVIPRSVTALLVVDSYSLFYSGFLIVTAALVVVLSFSYFQRRREHREEFYALILLATVGTIVLTASRHFASLFLGIEILSVSLYALVSYLREGKLALEAGIKYLVLAATSSAFLLFGLALLYAETGSMDLATVSYILMKPMSGTAVEIELAGLIFIVTGIGFKLAAVPFHLWTPDVYEGAPLPVTAFIASVSKGGVFAVLLRWFHSVSGHPGSPLWWTFVVMSIASMLLGNLLALQQNNIKRILACSSIANMGYLLLAFLCAGTFGLQAATYYLVAYAITIVGAFGLLICLCEGEADDYDLDALRGMFWRRPVVAGAFSVALLSLAGIPLTAGFLGKFYIVAAATVTPLWIPILILVISSTIGVYYYLRVLVPMFGMAEELPSGRGEGVPVHAIVSLAVLTALIFVLGVYPSPLWRLIQTISNAS